MYIKHLTYYLAHVKHSVSNRCFHLLLLQNLSGDVTLTS